MIIQVIVVHNLLDSEDDFRSGCRNSLSQGYTHLDDYNLRTYDRDMGSNHLQSF